ncbi:hypothetical protein BJY01DRAFT_252726 [Aspergillus pseudoustus]|uniref:Pectin lyase fold/virulence factor n=1 Tax=Aspergillus pseudoustus TaxID=1810923 RepID=A0ABR4J700_9EURO
MAFKSLALLSLSPFVLSSVIISDPGDYVNLSADVEDNAILADYLTDDGGPTELIYDITGPYAYHDADAELDHQTLSVDANDTSVVVITEGSNVNLSRVDVVKRGYSTWLNQASFYGVNAAVNVANGSTAHISHSNFTSHNGAAGIFAYGDNTTVYVSNTDFYSSGPVAHALYAAGNGTIHASNVRSYAGGNRCSTFSGDGPAGYIYVTDSVSYTAGVGSATFYALGEIHAKNVVGHSEQAPALFSDGLQKAVLENVDLTAGLLAGTILFSSSERRNGASISFTNSRLTTLREDMPALWFGNVIATASLVATELNTSSGVLLVANTSQITAAFNHFVGVEEKPTVQGAEVSVTVAESALQGDIIVYNGSSIAWNLTNHSAWTGSAYLNGTGSANLSISVDSTSTWTLTQDVSLEAFTNTDTRNKNIRSKGFNIHYNPAAPKNTWLESKTVTLPGGGKLRPRS